MSAPKHVDLDLEREYLACILQLEGEWQREHAASTSRLEPADCALPEHERIAAAIHAIVQRGDVANFVTLRSELEQAKVGPRTLEASDTLIAHGATGVDLRSMAARLATLASARRAREQLMRGLAALETLDLEGAREHAWEAAGAAQAAQATESLSLADSALIAAQALQQIDPSRARMNARTGYGVMDYAVRSLPGKSMTVVGGRTGCAKSSLMLGMAINQARDQGHRPGIVSLEDPEEIVGTRGLSYVSPVSSEALLDAGSLGQLQREILAGNAVLGARELRAIGVRVMYRLNRPLGEVLQAIRHLVTRDGCTIIYVDYLQAIRFGDSRDHKRAVSNAAQSIKAECQALGVPLVLGSQLSRPGKEKPYGEPHMSELKETGDLENMSEVIVMLWKTSDEETAQVRGKVAKVKWSPRRPRFELRFSETGSVHSVLPWNEEQQQPPTPMRGVSWRS